MDDPLARLYGCGDLDAMVPGDRHTVAWPRATRMRGMPLVPAERITEVLAGRPCLDEVDPRHLHASQTFLVRHHLRYYLTGEWERTGRTSADMDRPVNRYPLVVDDGHGHDVIVAGHHRSAAALLQGRPVLVRRLPRCGDPVAVTPLLRVAGAVEYGQRVRIRAELHGGKHEVIRLSTVRASGIPPTLEALSEVNDVNAGLIGVRLWMQDDLVVAGSDLPCQRIHDLVPASAALAAQVRDLGVFLAALASGQGSEP